MPWSFGEPGGCLRSTRMQWRVAGGGPIGEGWEIKLMKKSKRKTHLTPNEVAELLMVNPVTVRQWAARGLLRSLTTPGGHRRFLLSDVEEFARSRGTAPVPRSSGKPDRVLIVDDDTQVGLYVAQIIKS